LKKLSKGSHQEPEQVYDKAYAEALQRIEGQLLGNRKMAKKVLSWITHAERPLTTEELCHALAVKLGKLDEENIPDGEDIVSICAGLIAEELDWKNIPPAKRIISVCAGLVTVDEESTIIRLVHYTTKEYLERIRDNWCPRAQLKIATTCLTYLSFQPFRSGSCPSDKEFESRLKQNAFLDYASRYWGQHARTVQEQVFEVASLFLQDDNLVSSAAQTMSMSEDRCSDYSQDFFRKVTGVLLTARFGLLYLSERLLSQTSGNISISADSKDSAAQTPLLYAVERGHEAVVKLLLEKGAQLEPKGYAQAPLLLAAKNGREAVVKLLLEKGAQLDSKDNYGRTPLSLAAEIGREAVVKLLLEKGAQLESKDNDGRTPLSYAAEKGHEAVVKLLLEKVAELETKDKNYGQTPLFSH
jgi:hypothetical protein